MSQKEKFALYLTPEMKARLERRYTEDDSRSLTGIIAVSYTHLHAPRYSSRQMPYSMISFAASSTT